MDSAKSTLQLIKGSRLIDGKNNQPIEHGAVLIKRSQIVQAGSIYLITIPESAEVTEHCFSDCTILPGLVDAHSHLNLPGDGRNILEAMAEPDEILLLRSAQNARIALQSGVTTLRDNGGRKRTTFYLREAMRKGITEGPRLNLCGWPISITRGHCYMMGGEAEGVDGVIKAVQTVIAEGADYIKVMASGGDTPNSFPLLPSYTAEELRAAVDEAHRFGKLIGVHCTCTAAVVNALEAGADMIIHCNLQESDGGWKSHPDIVEKIAKGGIWVNPTLHVARSQYWALRDRRKKEGQSTDLDEELIEVKKRWENKKEVFQQLINAGAKIVAGGDTGWGYSRFGEFVYEIG